MLSQFSSVQQTLPEHLRSQAPVTPEYTCVSENMYGGLFTQGSVCIPALPGTYYFPTTEEEMEVPTG